MSRRMAAGTRLAVGTAIAGVLGVCVAAQTPTFEARIEVVYVDAFVTQGGLPVPALDASNFELKDNGVPQRAELVTAESQPLSAALVFDTSGSVAGERLAALRAAGEAFLDGLRDDDEIALLGFNFEIELLVPPTGDKSAVRSALARLRGQGSSAVMDALYAGLTVTEGPKRSLVVLFSDGQDNVSWLSERPMRLVAERSNAIVHVIGWQPPPPPPLPHLPGRAVQPTPIPREPDHIRALRQIAELTGGGFGEVESPERLRQAFAAIIERMNARYVLRYEPQGVPREGWHAIELRLRGAKGDIQTRRGYWVGPR